MTNGSRHGRWRAAIFDLDGTLIDTRPGVLEAIAEAFEDVVGTKPDVELGNLSLPLEDMIRSIEPTASAAQVESLSAAFRIHYDRAYWKVADVYPGAQDSLVALRRAGIRAFVVTNKRSTATERLLDHFELAPYFEAVVAQPDAGGALPKRTLMERCLVDAGLDPATTVLVGDSDQDANAAAACALAFVAVTSGAGPLGHTGPGEQRVEVEGLSDAAEFVLDQASGRRS